MSTANVSKIKNSVLPNITFILGVLSENGIFLPKWVYFSRSKRLLISQRFFLKSEAACACVNLCKYITSFYSMAHLYSYIVHSEALTL